MITNKEPSMTTAEQNHISQLRQNAMEHSAKTQKLVQTDVHNGIRITVNVKGATNEPNPIKDLRRVVNTIGVEL